jgi:hypothetical protein
MTTTFQLDEKKRIGQLAHKLGKNPKRIADKKRTIWHNLMQCGDGL